MISRLGDLAPETIPALSSRELAEKIKLSDRARLAFDDLKSTFDAGAAERRLEERGIRAITLADEEYPERLRGIPDSPPALFVNGELPAGPAVAIVGSRKCTVSGIEAARELGRALGERGVCVVSGLALGIDAAAHEGALLGDGLTVGVLGCGIDVIYPKRNRELYGRVSRDGAVISEYYLGEAPLAWRFPARNRIIAGLCETLVVVEAAERSGALITARHALDSGADVWAVPGPIGIVECRGSNKLLADGAGVLWDIPEFVEAAAPLQEELPRRKDREAGTKLPAGLPEHEAAVLSGVGFEPTEVDVISTRSGVGMRDLLPALTMLELKGYVGRNVSGAFVRKITV